MVNYSESENNFQLKIEEPDSDRFCGNPEEASVSNFPAGDCGGFSMKEEKPIILSDCRDLVLVSSGISGKIRELRTKYPNYAWEYPSGELLVSYQYQALRKGTDSRFPARSPQDLIGTQFWAHVTHVISQVDFFVRPKSITSVARKINELLAEYYEANEESVPFLTKEQIFRGVPCVVKTKETEGLESRWERGRVLSVPDGNTIRIRLIDSGRDCFVDSANEMRVLVSRFSRLPPLALHCRIDNVDINDLEINRVIEFHDLLHQIGYFIRVQILEVDCSPLLVEIFHPTEESLNLGTKYKSRGKSTVLTLPVRFGVAEDYGEVEEPSCDEESEEEDVPEPLPWVLRYNRLPKPQKRMENLVVSHVESAKAIYFLRKQTLSTIQNMEDDLAAACSDECESLPPDLIVLDVACAFSSGKGCWVRGVIRDMEMDDEGDIKTVTVQAIDHGWCREKISDLSSIKALPRKFDMDSMIYVGRLDGVCDELIKVDETSVLREILQEQATYSAEFPSRTHGPPFRVNVKFADGSTVTDRFNEEIEKRLIRRTLAVAVYDPKRIRYHTSAAYLPPPLNFPHSKALKSGRLAYGDKNKMVEA